MKSLMQLLSHDSTKPTPIHFIRAALALAALISSTGMASPPANQDAAGGEPVPLIVIDDVPSTDAIRNLARQAGINFIFDPRVPGANFGPGRFELNPSIHVRWTNLAVRTALGRLLKALNLTMVTNPATAVARIAPANLGVKPLPASQVGASTNAAIPLIVMDDVQIARAIRAFAAQADLSVSLDPKLSAPAFDGQGTISIRWENITARQALAALLDNYDLVLIEEPGTSSGRITFKTRGEIESAPRRDPVSKSD
jgi:hypothetical protein